MTRRLQPCRTCKPETEGKFRAIRGFTRHKDRICSRCRHYGPPMPSGWPWGRAA